MIVSSIRFIRMTEVRIFSVETRVVSHGRGQVANRNSRFYVPSFRDKEHILGLINQIKTIIIVLTSRKDVEDKVRVSKEINYNYIVTPTKLSKYCEVSGKGHMSIHTPQRENCATSIVWRYPSVSCLVPADAAS